MRLLGLKGHSTCDQESFTYSPQTVHTTKFSLSITSTLEATPTTAPPNEALDKLYTESIEKRRGIRRNSAHYGWLYKSQAFGRLREMHQVENRIMSADSSRTKSSWLQSVASKVSCMLTCRIKVIETGSLPSVRAISLGATV